MGHDDVHIAKPRICPQEDSALFRTYWEGTRQERLMVQRCRQTGLYVWPPRLASPYVPNGLLEWVDTEETGEIYTYNIMYRAFWPYYEDKLPYALVVVQLSDGVRMLGQFSGDVKDVSIGMSVQASYEHTEQGYTFVHWKPTYMAGGQNSE